MTVGSAVAQGEKAQALIALARIIMGGCFIYYGLSKLWFISGTIAFVGTKLPLPAFVFWLAVVIEAGLGFLLVVGFATRWAAAFLALYCVFTAAVFHTDFSVRVMMDHFFENIALAGGFLCLAAVGPGANALDNARNGG